MGAEVARLHETLLYQGNTLTSKKNVVSDDTNNIGSLFTQFRIANTISAIKDHHRSAIKDDTTSIRGKVEQLRPNHKSSSTSNSNPKWKSPEFERGNIVDTAGRVLGQIALVGGCFTWYLMVARRPTLPRRTTMDTGAGEIHRHTIGRPDTRKLDIIWKQA